MTPQQERIKQAERHEHLANLCRMLKKQPPRTIVAHDGTVVDRVKWFRARQRYHERVARQNRRAFKRNAS